MKKKVFLEIDGTLPTELQEPLPSVATLSLKEEETKAES